MKKSILLFLTCIMFLFVCGSVKAALIVGNGTEGGGTGPREYYYEVSINAAEEMDYFHLDTGCSVLSHYTNIVTPTNWTFSLVAITEDDYSLKTPHGSVSPGPTGTHDMVIQWSGSSYDLTGPGTINFGFDNFHPAHDVGFLISDDLTTVLVEDWSEDVGMGLGPIHAPVPEPATLCLFGLGGLLLRRRKKT